MRWCSVLRCSGCGASAGSCSSCGVALCSNCLGTHVCLLRESNDDFEDSPRGEPPGEANSMENLEAGTGGCDDSVQGWVDAFDQVRIAWEVGGAVQLKHNICVRVGRAPAQVTFDDDVGHRNFGESIDDFKRLAAELSWDVPNGLVILQLDRKKTIVFTAREANAVGIDNALSWLKHHDALGIAVRTHHGNIEIGVLDVTWAPGQSTRLPYFMSRFLEAARALGIA